MSAIKTYQAFEARGVPKHVIAGIMGNMAIESDGFKPNVSEYAPLVKGSRGGFGLNQWTGPRRRQYESFAKSKGADLGDIETQVDFTIWELSNTEKSAGKKLAQAQTWQEAADIYEKAFLRPGIPHSDRRQKAAGQIFELISSTEQPMEQPARMEQPKISPEVIEALKAKASQSKPQVSPEILEALRAKAGQANSENVISQGLGQDKSGRVIETENGRVYKSAGWATNDQAQIDAILGGADPAEVRQSSQDQDIISQNPIAARGAKVLQGVPFVGEFIDEAAGKLFPESKDAIRATNNAMDRERPKESGALRLGGTVAGSIPMALAAGPAIASNASLATKTAVASGVGAALGAAEGAASGYGRGENTEERTENMQNDALIGGALGGGLGLFAPVAAKGGSALIKKLKGWNYNEISEAFGITPKAAKAIRGFLVNEDFAAANKRLAELGDDAMLADAGPATAQALDSAAQTGGKALAITRKAVDDRANKLSPQIRSSLDRLLGKPGGVKAAAMEISKKSSKARERAYNAAYEQAIDYSSKGGRAIEGVLDRVPQKTLSKAVAEANEAMTEAGLSNKQLMAKIADDGSVSFEQMPNVQQLDYLKRALSDIAQGEIDQFGRISSGAGVRAARLSKDLSDAIGRAAPRYKTALKLGGDKIAEDDALKMGASIFSPKTTVEDVANTMRGASADARAAAKRGMRETIESRMGQVKAVISDPNIDAREAMALVKELSSKNNRSKLKLVLGDRDASALIKTMDRAALILETRSSVARNSATAIRQAGREAIDETVEPGVLRQVASGEPVGAVRTFVQSLTGNTGAATQARRAQVAEEMAKALTGIKGEEARKALALTRRLMKGMALKEDQADELTRLLGLPVLSGIHQLGKQSLIQSE